jgi:hypothetical protein
VLEVGHDRLAPRLDVNEVDMVRQIETCCAEHYAKVIGVVLRSVGYTFAFA